MGKGDFKGSCCVLINESMISRGCEEFKGKDTVSLLSYENFSLLMMCQDPFPLSLNSRNIGVLEFEKKTTKRNVSPF